MNYLSEDIRKSLKAARHNKRLSQRALSAKSGIPQSHISKIESGTVDLRVSSLVTLARILDLELVLVPTSLLPAIRLLSHDTSSLSSLQEPTPAYQLDDTDD